MINLSQIEISKENLINNFNQFSINLNKSTPETKIAVVVKANAYGHGVKEIVSILDSLNPSPDYYQIDDMLELREIRQYTQKPVLVFGFVEPSHFAEFVNLDAILGIYDLEIARQLNSTARQNNKIVKVHVKIDSLLGRQGILKEDAEDFFLTLKELHNLNVEAIYSHFSNIEDVDDLNHAKSQFENLISVKDIAIKIGFENIFHHISATGGFMTNNEGLWGGGIARIGIGLYGLWPSDELKLKYFDQFNLKPVMRWTSHLVQVKTVPENYPIGYGCTYVTKKPTKIAVVPQGYSDGYNRSFSNKKEVLVSGKRCKILGRVAMNMFVIEIPDTLKAKRDDEVVLLGKQGSEEITAEELAGDETINYEIVTRVWPKLPRIIL